MEICLVNQLIQKLKKYIGDIAEVQEANQDISKGEYNRSEVIKTYKEGIDNTTELISYKIKKRFKRKYSS